ncbi:hypothetical protein BCR44DRAFT_211425 [Catenaria anguillulae PL171]|uniref:Uncharacterized protein n=1 Tax=Catenaria anguillulae PL171 TaxID=765915 RepID=A0A1Y2HZP8_9FUNG|nr:hypothetical protein BCR44DRAFT_211425 [Catenaria anguillulae PL171]
MKTNQAIGSVTSVVDIVVGILNQNEFELCNQRTRPNGDAARCTIVNPSDRNLAPTKLRLFFFGRHRHSTDTLSSIGDDIHSLFANPNCDWRALQALYSEVCTVCLAFGFLVVVSCLNMRQNTTDKTARRSP